MFFKFYMVFKQQLGKFEARKRLYLEEISEKNETFQRPPATPA